MKGFFKSPVLQPTGFAKMQNHDEIRDKISRVLADADTAYLEMQDHAIGFRNKDWLHEYCETFRQEVAAIAVQASYLTRYHLEVGNSSEVDKLMLDFVVAKAWGTYHALSRQMDMADRN